MSRALIALLLAPPLGAACVVSCGPSVSSIYEGNIRFEHCYRLDLDPNIAPSHRETCWREFTRRYTYGQTRDRVDYARRRIASLEAGDHSRPLLDLRAEVDAGPGQSAVVEAPAPTSLHKPPPPTQKTSAPAPPPPPTPDAGPRPPGDECARECRANWRTCNVGCGPDGGASKRACASCEKDYKSCVRRCLE